MTSYIGPICDSIIDSVVVEIKKPETKEKIMNDIVDPFLADMLNRYYPYFMVIIVFLFIVVVLLLAILLLSVSNKNNMQ